ncbi:hypothetical protein [Leucobacter sp. G161]|uniref:hypothetical protein n=1 Tax=Leucobacter sp. G161 TaxID=663704 RepID=UPI00073C3231|nr:hypothetical protein [Leucobacter sp. G161]KUF06769.1 hypothetical protein AUL38_10955 [Leucobacter sp. G161]
MHQKFSGFKARDYEFRNDDGTTDRHVIVIYMGVKRAGFMEYADAYKFVNRIHDLTEAHERRDTQP